MAEYLHELKEDEESSEVPDLPTEETDFSSNDFSSTEEEAPLASDEAETTFGSEETTFGSDETTFGSEETTFGSDETTFGSEETTFGSDETTFGSDETTFGSDETTFGSEETTFGSEETTFGTEETLDFGNTEAPSNDVNFGEELSSSLTEPETEPEPISDPTPTYEPEPVIRSQEQSFKTPENFEDLKKFAESTSISGMGAEGNPSFSVLLKNIRYIEDVNDILALMKELSLLSDPEEQIRQRLMRGHLLIPRISEYAAIFLAHKLRRFDIDIQVGLSDEIHPPKHQEAPETGLVSKFTLYQNQTHHFHFDDPKLEIAQIIVAATPNLEGHQVIRYLGVASEHKMLDGHIVEDEDSSEIPRYYSELAQKLKAHALKANANAVIGLNYQLTPLPSEYGMSGSKYRLSCTGNLVWVNKL